jgi:hypothetical protein
MDLNKKMKRMWDEEAERYDLQFEINRKIAITARVVNRLDKEMQLRPSAVTASI